MTKKTKKISHTDLIPMDLFTNSHPIRIDLVYAQENHPDNIFKQAIYPSNAKCWAYKKMAMVTLLAAHHCFEKHGLYFSIKDCLRTTNAQQRMQETEIVKANPHWCEGPTRLLSPPGKGGHPRGMAIDITLETENGDEIPMGTKFDHLTVDPNHNPAARNYTNFDDPQILINRRILEDSIMHAAQKLEFDILPLPAEWWDFRFQYDYYNKYEPLSDKDIPSSLKYTKNVSNKILDRIKKYM